MIQFNDITQIGDSFEIHSNTPIIGVKSISGYSDVTYGETSDRYFVREFCVSFNGITYTNWQLLTNESVIEIFAGENNIFDIKYRYTRAGTNNTGNLTFVSIQLTGQIVDQATLFSFDDLYFKQFFNYYDSSVMGWAINVLNKLHKDGIIAKYIERNGDDVSQDDDFLSFWGAITHFFAIIVRYAREFQNFTSNQKLLNRYLVQKGLFLDDSIGLSDLQAMLANFYESFLERGTNQITAFAGDIHANGTIVPVNGELLRLINIQPNDEFLFGLIEAKKTIWNVGNNSPMYRGTKEAVNLIKGYETTERVTSLTNYPLIQSSFISIVNDVRGTKDINAIRILNPLYVPFSGIGDALTADKLIKIDNRISYEVTFYVKQPILGNHLSLKIYLYDKDKALLTNSPISATTGSFTNVSIDKKSLLRNDIYYFVRLILFNKTATHTTDKTLDIGLGNHLILNNDAAKYISVNLGSEFFGIYNINSELRISDFKVRPLMTNISNSFVMIPNVINSYLENNATDTNQIIKNKISRYLLPYNSILINQFFDEPFIISGDPLKMQAAWTNETIVGSNNGTIKITAYGGVPPYVYSKDNSVTFTNQPNYQNLNPGTYNLAVKDSIGTIVTESIIIAVGQVSLNFTTSKHSSSKLDVADGDLTVFATGGYPAYWYNINNGAANSWQLSNFFNGLMSGTYHVWIQDVLGNQFNKDVFIDSIRKITVIINIKDEKGYNITGVSILIEAGLAVPETYTTNGSGNATVYFQAGSYLFNVSKSGYENFSTWHTITSGGTWHLIMQTYYSVVYNIKDELGVNVPGATVTVLGYSGTTDSSGNVTVPNLIKGTYVFETSKTGYKASSHSYFIDHSQTINNVIQTYYSVQFKTQTYDPINLGGGAVTGVILLSLSYPPEGNGLNTITGVGGLVTVNDLVRGIYNVQSTASDYAVKTQNVTVPAVSQPVLIDLDSNLPVYNMTIYVNATPPSGSQVYIHDKWGNQIRSLTTGVLGAVILTLREGNYTVSIVKAGYHSISNVNFFLITDNYSMTFDLIPY
jgi:hypothetical protein